MSRWTLRAVAALPSSNPYLDLHTRRHAVKPPVNSSCFSPMQPAAAERGNEWHKALDLEAPTLMLDHARRRDGLMVARQYLMEICTEKDFHCLLFSGGLTCPRRPTLEELSEEARPHSLTC